MLMQLHMMYKGNIGVHIVYMQTVYQADEVLLLGKFVKKYVDTFTYDELLDLYKILEEDDDEIFKWYSGSENNNKIIENKVSGLLKKFKPWLAERVGFEPTNE